MRARELIGVLAAMVLVAAVGCSAAADPGETSSAVVTRPDPTVATSPTTPPVSTASPVSTVSQAPTTVVTTPTEPTLVPPPPSTAEPAATPGDCPYLPTAEVSEANGQRISRTSVIAVTPYPICQFFRPDGTVMAVTRIVKAGSAAAAAAAVNQHVPIDQSFPATHPSGWTGGAMATPNGVPGYPDAGSIYAVSKGDIAIIAISNQKQSIKGRQMVTDIVTNLGL